MTRRHPSREERALWRAAMRDVTRLPETTPPDLPAVESPPPRPPRARQEASGALAPGAAPGLDRRSAQRLRRGQLGIEARLDLHGMTQAEAHRALDDFLARAASAGRRSVLVITGKSGVLRAAVPRWIDEQPNRSRVLGVAPAQPKDGGAGALYLLLRRKR